MLGLDWGYSYIRVILGLYESYVGIMERNLETTMGLYWGYMGIMEKNMETTIL